MTRTVRALAATAFLLAAVSTHASLWFGDNDGTHRVDAAASRSVLDIRTDPPAALATDAADDSVWVLTQSRLERYASDGTLRFGAALRTYSNNLGASRLLALNPADGSLWVATERQLVHVGAGGALLGASNVSAVDMAVAQDGTLWVLAANEIRHHAGEGALIASFPLAGPSQGARYLGLDDAGGVLWLAGAKRLEQRPLASPGTPSLAVTLAETTPGLAVDVRTGTLYVLGQQSVFGFARDGASLFSRDLRQFGIANAQSIVFDFETQSLWVGHQQGLTRLDTGGQHVATLPATVRAAALAIGRAPVDVEPTLSLVSPAAGQTVTTTVPPIVFQYGADCSGRPCGFPPSYFGSYALAATVDGQTLSATFDPATGRATATPPTLGQGTHRILGTATDAFGRASNTVDSSFFVDTIAPRFLTLTPPSGSTFASPGIVIGGSTDDPASIVRLSGSPTPAGQNFSFPVTLALGTNNFTLTAADPFGNTETRFLLYTFDPPNVPPTVSITAPADGARFDAPASFAVNATAADPDGAVAGVAFFVNGQLAGTDTLSPYSTSLTNLGVGTYVLTAQATDNRGGTATSAPVTVTVGTPNAAPTVRLTWPKAATSYAAPATIYLTAEAADSDGGIARVEFLRNGALVGTATTAPYAFTATGVAAGSQSFTARAVDDRGAATMSAAVTVSVQSVAVSIASPASGAAVDGETLLVQGSFQGPAGTGVTVNGAPAGVTGNQFTALVPIVPGAIALEARAFAPDGTAATHVVTVNASGTPPPIDVTLSASEGFAPLPVTFTIRNLAAADLTFTFDGFGPFGLPGSATVALSVTYPAGIHAPEIVVTHSSGASSRSRYLVESIDAAALDQQLRAIWGLLGEALVAGDKARALGFLSGAGREKYGPVFDQLLPAMPSIIASFSPLRAGMASPRLMEYAVNRTIGGVNRIFFINFLRDSDGAWRVDSM
jgi:hypothetical protein